LSKKLDDLILEDAILAANDLFLEEITEQLKNERS